MSENEQMDVSLAEEYFRAALQFAQFRLIQKEIPPQETSEGSDSLDERVVKRIEICFREQHRKKIMIKNTVAILKTIAIILMVVNLCATVAFALSGTLRERIMNLFVVTYTTHSNIEITGGSGNTPNTVSDVFPDYAASWFPNDRFTVTEKSSFPEFQNTTYSDGTGVLIFLDVNSESVVENVNTEGMTEKSVRIGGKDLRVFHSDGKSFIIWQEDSLYFILSAINMTETEAILVAVSVTAVDDPGTGAYGIQ